MKPLKVVPSNAAGDINVRCLEGVDASKITTTHYNGAAL
jgi:hypothetical protein